MQPQTAICEEEVVFDWSFSGLIVSQKKEKSLKKCGEGRAMPLVNNTSFLK